MKPVTKHTRAPKNGKSILCPLCNSLTTVYHFGWSALTCAHCNEMVAKYDWLINPVVVHAAYTN